MPIVAESEQIADRRNSPLESKVWIFDGSRGQNRPIGFKQTLAWFAKKIQKANVRRKQIGVLKFGCVAKLKTLPRVAPSGCRAGP